MTLALLRPHDDVLIEHRLDGAPVPRGAGLARPLVKRLEKRHLSGFGSETLHWMLAE